MNTAHVSSLKESGPFKALNTVPIRQIHERWVSKYQEHWAAQLTVLKRDLEDVNTPDA